METKFRGEGNIRKKVTFQSLKVSEWLQKQLTTLSIKAPSEIQQKAIPVIKSGKNVIGISHTGSGKTAAFAIPILDKLAEDPYAFFALVLSPTRELALQIADQFRAFGAPIQLRIALIVGGENLLQQNKELDKYPHIVISTPGRLYGIIESNPTFKFKHMKFLVLDEADTMLHLDYSIQLKAILNFLPPAENRQTLLFSATMSRSIRELGSIAIDKPEVIRVSKEFDVSPTLIQEFVFMPLKVKHTYLVFLLQELRKRATAIVFVPSIQAAAEIQLMLEKLKISSAAIHSLLSQEERKATISGFRDNKFNILIATNLASRGLDIPNVSVVINFDIPERTFDYIHRVGRTARGGKKGRAINMVSQYETDLVKEIESRLGVKWIEHGVKDSEVLKCLTFAVQALKYAETKLAHSKFAEKLAKLQQHSKDSQALIKETLEEEEYQYHEKRGVIDQDEEEGYNDGDADDAEWYKQQQQKRRKVEADGKE